MLNFLWNLLVTKWSMYLAVMAIFSGYYFVFVAKRPRVHTGNAKMKRFLDTHVSTLRQQFFPFPFLADGRLQTVFGVISRATTPARIPYSRELYQLSDGGHLALDYFMHDSAGTNSAESPAMILLLPGLGSASQSGYIRTLVLSLNKAGSSVVVMNHRGTGGVEFTSPRTYSASYIDDLAEVAPYIKKKFSSHRIIAIGTSLGGIVLSKYLICRSEEAKRWLDYAILISIVWDGFAGMRSVEATVINRLIISRRLGLAWVKLWKRFIAKFESPPFKFDAKMALNATSLREFDTAVTAPQFGFETVDEYHYSVCSVGNVYKYTIPVFAVHAMDDPVQPGDSLPFKEAGNIDSKLAIIMTKRGGHLGWVESITRKSEHYVERLTGELVVALRLHGRVELT